MSKNKVPYHVILAAKQGNPDAMNQILSHYSGYINHFSRRKYYDQYGNALEVIDEEIRQHIETALMMQIIYKFDCFFYERNRRKIADCADGATTKRIWIMYVLMKLAI